MEGDPLLVLPYFGHLYISIHSLRMEGDSALYFLSPSILLFQSTPSAWRETSSLCSLSKNVTSFQSTPSAWRETVIFNIFFTFRKISIHSLRMEGDELLPFRLTGTSYFNPLPPHGGRLEPRSNIVLFDVISIHSLRMEGDFPDYCGLGDIVISIHSLRMEGD